MSGLEAAALAALGKMTAAAYSATAHELTYEAAVKLVSTLEAFGTKELLHPDYVSALEVMDIKASVCTIQALIDDLRIISNHDSKSIEVCMTNLHETVTKIEKELSNIEKKCHDWKVTWWSYVYSYPDCGHEISNLTKLKAVMDNRIELLTRAVTLELQMKSLRNDNKTTGTGTGTGAVEEDDQTEMTQP